MRMGRLPFCDRFRRSIRIVLACRAGPTAAAPHWLPWRRTRPAFRPAIRRWGFARRSPFYPACGLKDHFAATRYQAYAPLRVYIGTADEEVSPQRCRTLLTDAGGDVRIHFYDEATHDFDDPGPRRQQLPANAEARGDVIERVRSFFAKKLGASPGGE